MLVFKDTICNRTANISYSRHLAIPSAVYYTKLLIWCALRCNTGQKLKRQLSQVVKLPGLYTKCGLMRKAKYVLILLAICNPIQVLGDDVIWPVKREIDLSSGFGDYRSGRFHAGIDIRTGGVVGEPVYSPTDGYVWRIRTNYYGYGKALYIRGVGDRIYVFAHLNKFVPEIEKIVKASQLESERYYVDIYLPVDSIKVTAGQLIAQSGETGAGPPHLHFESRSSDNRPINPVSHGFDLADQTKPVFERIGFQATDENSLFDVGLRKAFFKVKRGGRSGEYLLDTTLYFNSPFGVVVDCHDLMRPNGMRSTVRKLTLVIDDVPYYESIFDTLDYGTEQSAFFEYDYYEALDERSKVRKLFAEDGNIFVGSKAKSGFKGYIGETSNEKQGLRRGEIIAEDCCGNQSRLKFRFIWGPNGNIFDLDSTVTISRDTTKFHFTALPGFENFEIDSVAVFASKGDKWGPPTFVRTRFTTDGRLVSTVVSNTLSPLLLRLFVFAGKDCLIRDNIFNGLLESLPKPAGPAVISSDEDGLWLTVVNFNRAASRLWIKMYHENTLLGTNEAQLFNMKTYRCLIPPKEEYAVIDKFGFVFGESPDGFEVFVDTLQFHAVGFGPKEIVSKDGRFTAKFSENTLYRPLFVQLRHLEIYNKVIMNLNSDSYEILPEAFRCREDFTVSIKLLGELPKNQQTGICWLDKKKGPWVWLKTNNEMNLLSAKSRGGGTFAAVVDYDNPVISGLNIRANEFYVNPELPIKFNLRDSLSGFEDDRSIVINLDGKWIIPEYDPETSVCISQPNEPLEPGEHHLGIEIVDRAGNKSEKYLKFKIRHPYR